MSEYNVEKEKRDSVGAISIVVVPLSAPGIVKMRKSLMCFETMRASIPSTGGGRRFQGLAEVHKNGDPNHQRKG